MTKLVKCKNVRVRQDGVIEYVSPFTPNNGLARVMGLSDPLFLILSSGRGLALAKLTRTAVPIINKIRGKGFNLDKEFPDAKSKSYKIGRGGGGKE